MREGYMSEKKEWNEMTMATKYQHSGSSLRRDSQARGWGPPGAFHTPTVYRT